MRTTEKPPEDLTLKKTTAALALAALAVPAAAQADRPDNRGTKNAAERQERNEQRAAQKQNKSKRFKGVGFAVSGVDYKGAALTSSKEEQDVAEFTLDVTSANRHARRYLELATRPSKKAPAQDTPISDTVDGKAIVRLVGFEQGETPDADDRVKVIGRVTRVKKDDTTTERKLDIRRIVIKDVDPETETADQDD